MIPLNGLTFLLGPMVAEMVLRTFIYFALYATRTASLWMLSDTTNGYLGGICLTAY